MRKPHPIQPVAGPLRSTNMFYLIESDSTYISMYSKVILVNLDMETSPPDISQWNESASVRPFVPAVII